jgi:hypothetical protein
MNAGGLSSDFEVEKGRARRVGKSQEDNHEIYEIGLENELSGG